MQKRLNQSDAAWGAEWGGFREPVDVDAPTGRVVLEYLAD